ncbi:MAG: hypothetical protein GX605_01880 [Chloroflexi bacterium]|nr:hypothetical protein [Chloroflexota bacterium]
MPQQGAESLAEHQQRADAAALGLVLLLSLPGVARLAAPGYFNAIDSLLHLYRLMGLDQALQGGVVYPRWFPSFAFGYGQPVLNFYGPLAYYLGQALVLLGADLVAAAKGAYALSFLAAGPAMYLLARQVFAGQRLPAMAAALAYVYAPYHLTDLVVRGALAELLAMAWLPLILWAAGRVALGGRPAHLLALAGGLAGLVVTHSLSLLLLAPALALYLLGLWAAAGRVQGLGRLTAAGLLALGLTAFYWLPLVTESGYVGLALGHSAGYRDHLAPLSSFVASEPLYRYAPYQSTAAEHLTSLWLLALALPGAALAASRRAARGTRWALAALLAMALGGLFMTLQVSLPLWQALEPLLAFLQYPWRFQAVVSLGLAGLVGGGVALASRAHAPRPLAWGVAAAASAILAVHALGALPPAALPLAAAEVTHQRMWAEERAVGQIGSTWTGEYLPLWVREQRWAIGRSWLDSGGPDLEEANAPRAPDQLRLVGHRPLQLQAAVTCRQPCTLILHQFHYPGMGALLGGQRLAARPYGALGLAAIDLPAGQHQVSAGLFPTAAQKAGSAVSLAALALTAFLTWRLAGPRRLALLAGLALLAATALLARGWATPQPPAPAHVGAEFGGQAALVAHSTAAAPAHPGQALPLTLWWLARAGFANDLVAYVHLTAPEGGPPLSQSDQQPDGGFTPTTRWVAGEIIPDRHSLPVPADLPAGRYALYAGLYEPTPLRPLAITSSDQPTDSGRVLLGYVEVTAP